MYLLDTKTFSDFVRGNVDDVKTLCAGAEERNVRIAVSVISVGILRFEIGRLDPAHRGNWEERLDVAVGKMLVNFQLEPVTPPVADEWAHVKAHTLVDGSGNTIGDDERLVLATAIALGLRLVTRYAHLYEALAKSRGLKLQPL